MKLKKLASIALAGALTLGLLPALSSPALAADGDTSYTLTIPSTLTVANSGWNATTGISATGTLASGKKLTVTASSANSWALKSGDNTVSYTLTTASGGSQTTAWEFTTLDGTAKPMGIIVADYSTKPAGTYTDTVTFTAKVENAVTTRTVTWGISDITSTGGNGNSFTKDGITITAGQIDFHDANFMQGGTITTSSGKFTKIEVTPIQTVSGTGWSMGSGGNTWTGDASSSVSFSGDISGEGDSLTIVFTIEE